jgi:hypothetical protein
MEDLRELKWHPQFKNLLATTQADGFDIFSPDNEPENNTNQSPNDLDVEF